jgi:hypothetical protein
MTMDLAKLAQDLGRKFPDLDIRLKHDHETREFVECLEIDLLNVATPLCDADQRRMFRICQEAGLAKNGDVSIGYATTIEAALRHSSPSGLATNVS